MFSGWFGEKVYNWVHGNHLVHNTCWDDPRLNLKALRLRPDDSLLVITSAGCNALDYALAAPARIDAVDANPRHTALLELKQAAIRRLDYDAFFALFGEGHCPRAETLYRDSLRAELSDWSRSYWDRWITLFSDRHCTFFYRGATGRFANWLNFYINRVLRLRPILRDLLEATTIAEQQWIYEHHLRDRLWTSGLRFAIERESMLSFVGVPPGQQWQIARDYRTGVAGYLRDRWEAILARHALARNYFWRVYLTGAYTSTCCPDYLRPENFARLKHGLVDRVHAHTDTLAGFLVGTPHQYSRFVLSDTMDKLSVRHRDQLQTAWQNLVYRAEPGARLTWHSGGVRTDFVDELVVDLNGRRREVGELLRYLRQLGWQLQQQDRVGAHASMFVAELAA